MGKRQPGKSRAEEPRREGKTKEANRRGKVIKKQRRRRAEEGIEER